MSRSMAVALATTFVGFIAACSRDEGESSLVPEARADATKQKDFGWRTTPDYPAKPQDDVREYH